MRFVVASPGRSVCDHYARALDARGLLGFYALGTRHGVAGVRAESTALFPLFGLLNYIGCQFLSPFQAESFRFRLGDLFDRWLRRRLRPGDVLISAPGYVSSSAAWLQANRGATLLDCGNSHPRNFWEILEPEHRAWRVRTPPVAPHHIRRCLRTIEFAQGVFCPSEFVRRSFREKGFPPEKILPTIYPVDFRCFTPRPGPRPAGRPFTVVNTGSLSLRKGTPYLLEALRELKKHVPDLRILLNRAVADSVKQVLSEYQDLPIDWSPNLPPDRLADRLREADIFILPSLEEGLARTALEAMACGLPVVVTPNTGVNDFVCEGISGSVVSLRDPQAIVRAALDWREKILRAAEPPRSLLDLSQFSATAFERQFFENLAQLNLHSLRN